MAIEQVECWLECPSLSLLGETGGYWAVLKAALIAGNLTGPIIHDARIAAICRHHGVKALRSCDRDFSRMSGLRIVNPLL